MQFQQNVTICIMSTIVVSTHSKYGIVCIYILLYVSSKLDRTKLTTFIKNSKLLHLIFCFYHLVFIFDIYVSSYHLIKQGYLWIWNTEKSKYFVEGNLTKYTEDSGRGSSWTHVTFFSTSVCNVAQKIIFATEKVFFCTWSTLCNYIKPNYFLILLKCVPCSQCIDGVKLSGVLATFFWDFVQEFVVIPH